ncbi:hypothetical protein AB0M92_16525 [Streptomyces sp. NPDC051582]|uniref:hypothetical protein n=1 Tax=Streptomyces sp. NPDC051582 TaxID=3155167 RepID=UPI00343EC9DF
MRFEMLGEPEERLLSRIIRGRESGQDPGGGEVLRTASLKLLPGFLGALRYGRVLPVEVLRLLVPQADGKASFLTTDLQVVLGVRQGIDGSGQSIAVVDSSKRRASRFGSGGKIVTWLSHGFAPTSVSADLCPIWQDPRSRDVAAERSAGARAGVRGLGGGEV